MPEQRQCLAYFLAEAHAQCIPHETEEEAVAWIECRPIGITYELHDVKNEDNDVPAAKPDARRPIGQHLQEQQEQNANRSREKTVKKEMNRIRRLLRGEKEEKGHEQHGGAGREAPVGKTTPRKPGANQLMLWKNVEHFFDRRPPLFIVLRCLVNIAMQLQDAELDIQRRRLHGLQETLLEVFPIHVFQKRKGQRQQSQYQQPMQVPQP